MPGLPQDQTATPEIHLRPYQPGDREALFRIAADTAFFGAPIEIYMEDRRIFLESFYAYYTDYEPEHCWIACADGQVAGFLTGSTDTTRQTEITDRVLVPRVRRQVLRGEYRLGPKSLRYLFELWLAGRRDEGAGADLQRYPAHLHINVDARWRGYGLGKKLMLAYLDQLRRLGIPGVFLQTTSRNQTACRLYENLGFQLLAAAPSKMWRWKFKEALENRCYGLVLGGETE